MYPNLSLAGQGQYCCVLFFALKVIVINSARSLKGVAAILNLVVKQIAISAARQLRGKVTICTEHYKCTPSYSSVSASYNFVASQYASPLKESVETHKTNISVWLHCMKKMTTSKE